MPSSPPFLHLLPKLKQHDLCVLEALQRWVEIHDIGLELVLVWLSAKMVCTILSDLGHLHCGQPALCHFTDNSGGCPGMFESPIILSSLWNITQIQKV